MILSDPVLTPICTFEINLSHIKEMGQGRSGKRRIIPIIGGTVTGNSTGNPTGRTINGRILNLGADWQTIFAGGLAELDTRYAIETDDGALIEVQNYGYRHGPEDVIAAIAKGETVSPDSYYMRTHAKLETGDERYDWVNKTLFVGTGARLSQSVTLQLYAIQ